LTGRFLLEKFTLILKRDSYYSNVITMSCKKVSEHQVVLGAAMIAILFLVSQHAVYATSSAGIIEPLYSKPFLNGLFYWQPVIDAKTAHPNVPFFAIVNPADGPGRPPPTCAYQGDPLDNLTRDYQVGIGNLTRAGIVVLGYVDTINDTTGIQKQYGQVTQEIDTWTSCYPGIRGILLDDMQTWPFTAGNLTYYQNLTNYIHDNKKLQYSYGNPGTDTDPRFLDTVDAMNIFENGTLPQDSILKGVNNWHLQYSKSHFMFVAYNQSALPNAAWIQQASLYVKFIFFTNYTLPNPWSSIPSYLNTELADLDLPSILIKLNSVEPNGSSLSGPLVQISQQINQTYNLARTENTPFDYNTTSGLIYKITTQSCYGNWRFNYWQLTPWQFNHKQSTPWQFNHLEHTLNNPYYSTIYVVPTSNMTLTANYRYDANCNSTQFVHDPTQAYNAWDYWGYSDK
jgi:hypothetical protein